MWGQNRLGFLQDEVKNGSSKWMSVLVRYVESLGTLLERMVIYFHYFHLLHWFRLTFVAFICLTLRIACLREREVKLSELEICTLFFGNDLWLITIYLITIYFHDIHKSKSRFIKIKFLTVFRSLGRSISLHCRLVVWKTWLHMGEHNILNRRI